MTLASAAYSTDRDSSRSCCPSGGFTPQNLVMGGISVGSIIGVVLTVVAGNTIDGRVCTKAMDTFKTYCDKTNTTTFCKDLHSQEDLACRDIYICTIVSLVFTVIFLSSCSTMVYLCVKGTSKTVKAGIVNCQNCCRKCEYEGVQTETEVHQGAL